MRPALLVIAAAIASATVPLQAAEKEGRKRPGRFRIGPVYLTPKLQLKNAGVDTNVFNQHTGEVSDTSVVLSPTLLGAIPVGRRLRLTGESHLDLNYFRRERSERSTDFGGEGRAELDIGLVTLFGAGGGGQSRQRFSIDIDQRVLRHERWATAGLGIAPTTRASATLSGTGRVYEFASLRIGGFNIKENLDRNELSATVRFRYALTRQTALVLSADAIEDRFLRQPRAVSRVTRSYRYLAGLEFGAKALIRGKVLAGMREFPASGAAPAYRGPALAVSSSVPLLQHGLLTVFVERDVFYALTPVVVASDSFRNAYVSTRLAGDLEVGLPFSLVGRGTFGLEQARYLLPYPDGNRFTPRVDHLWTAGGSLLRVFRAGVRVGATLQWGRRVSSFPLYSYEGLRYGVQAELAP